MLPLEAARVQQLKALLRRFLAAEKLNEATPALIFVIIIVI
jgi:hypothetical protein